MVKLLDQASDLLADFQRLNLNFEQDTPDHKITNLADYFDHTLLKNDALSEEIIQHCRDAVSAGCMAVCVHPGYVAVAKKELEKLTTDHARQPKLCTVAAFPFGTELAATKAAEVRQLCDLGVQEIDFVAPIYLIKDAQWFEVAAEFDLIRKTAPNICLKVILENCLLTDLEKIATALIAIDCKLDYLKTSTGFSKSGASLHDIGLLKYVARDLIKIKAAGGIKTKNFATSLINLGADRIGASSSLAIINAT